MSFTTLVLLEYTRGPVCCTRWNHTRGEIVGLKRTKTYRVETPRGYLPDVFTTKKEAEAWAVAALSWSGTKYRIVTMYTFMMEEEAA